MTPPISRRFEVCLLWGGLLVALLFGPGPSAAHTIYLMSDNHTDYGWNGTPETYDAAMNSELDFYLGQIALTAGNPPAEQARFNADVWYYLYNYEQTHTPTEFQALIDAMLTGHITAPLNPLVVLYGAMPTEAAIRAGYYPGRIEREYGVPFRLAQNIENHTNPWGLASLWAGSEAEYTWKGVCGCASNAPFANQTTEVFRWQGPDDKELLFKWYTKTGSNKSWGGYSEARSIVDSGNPQSGIQSAIDRFSARPPMLPITGLFGLGWDDISYESTTLPEIVADWNADHPGGDQAVVSNGVDYFEALEAFRDELPILRGGWGNDWDMWAAALSSQTAKTRDAIERMRSAEALAAVAHWDDDSLWAASQTSLEAGLVDYFKYFEHSWGTFGVSLQGLVDDKFEWAANVDLAVAGADTSAANSVAGLFETPDEDRFAVFNPLGFERTDYADLPAPGAGPFIVTDVTSGEEVPNQLVTLDGDPFLRILARDVPALGYRVYRYAAGTPTPLSNAASINGSVLESDRYIVEVGTRGNLVSVIDKLTQQELAGSGGLNDWGAGFGPTPVAENVGPVSVSVVADINGGGSRRVRITLIREVDRIETVDELFESLSFAKRYRFDTNLSDPQIRFEEIGAIARPGLPEQGGDFLPGTDSEYMTLNHFVNLEGENYNVTVSNWDAFAMRVGSSSASSFDLPTSEVGVLAIGNPANSSITDQGGDTYFLNRFAIAGAAGAYSGADSMRMSLAHQNPLRAIALPRNQSGPLTPTSLALASVDAPNVVITAFKPVEEGERGLALRAWELSGQATNFEIDVSAFQPSGAFEMSLIETDLGPAALTDGKIQASIGANEIKTWRFLPTPLDEISFDPCSQGEDTDGDGLVDACDNCILQPNGPDNSLFGNQLDGDGDGYGNICDGDFDQAFPVVGLLDLLQMRDALGKAVSSSDCLSDGFVPGASCAEFDMDGNLPIIALSDLTLFRALLGTVPGPSGFNPVCGNGYVESGEQCDDGNQDPGDGCDSTCQAEVGAPASTCGLGFELALALPACAAVRRRLRRTR